MSLIYIVDTNILSEPTKKAPNLHVVEKLLEHQYEIATASPVYYELLMGTRRLPKSARRHKLEAYLKGFISTLPILPYDDNAADWHAKEIVRLTNLGLTPAFIDAQIASIAATNRLIVVSRNVTDFEHFLGLDVENWFN